MTYLSLLKDKRLDEAEMCRRKSVPSKLIKFVSLTNGNDEESVESNNRRFSALSNQQLWFSTPEKLNDPYEFEGMFIDRERLKELNYPDGEIDFFETLLSKLKTEFALVSLSGNSIKCPPMWAYYTNNYSGFCVEYDVLKPDKIQKVIYELDRIPIASIFVNFLIESEKLAEFGQITSKEYEFYATNITKLFFLKDKVWSHENEYRAIWPVKCKDVFLVGINNVGLKTSRIVAGNKCSDDHKKRLAEISNSLGCGEISVF